MVKSRQINMRMTENQIKKLNDIRKQFNLEHFTNIDLTNFILLLITEGIKSKYYDCLKFWLE